MTDQEEVRPAPASRHRPVVLTIFLVLAIATIYLVRQIMIATAQGRATQIALQKSASVEYDYYFENGDPHGQRLPGARPPSPAFLRQNVVGLMTSGPKWRDSDLALLNDMPYLVKLELNSNPNIGDSGMVNVGSCPRLRSLTVLALPLVTDAGLAQLGHLTSLRELDIEQMHITDAGVLPLLALKNLESLGLSGTRITDSSLQKLRSLPRLKRLNIRQTQVTARGVNELRRSCPGLEIDAGRLAK